MFTFVTFQIFRLYFSKAGDFQNWRESWSRAYIGRVGIYALLTGCIFLKVLLIINSFSLLVYLARFLQFSNLYWLANYLGYIAGLCLNRLSQTASATSSFKLLLQIAASATSCLFEFSIRLLWYFCFYVALRPAREKQIHRKI